MMTALAMILAVALDALWGEPRRFHPLVGFGWLATWLERHWHRDTRWNGVLAWSVCAAVPAVLLYAGRQRLPAVAAFVLDVLVLYAAIGLRSLAEHARPVADALGRDDLPAARNLVSRVVSRDTDRLAPAQVAGAATESVLENGHDAVFGALFWFACLGAPGALLFRLANTLDAMWGYRTPRYLRFGWAAARADDVLGYLPARITAFTYAIVGRFDAAMRCWRTQAPAWKSPNAGPVMAAGAGALGVELGGAAPYHGQWQPRPPLGEGDAPSPASIHAALRLVRRGVVLWLGLTVLLGAVAHA
jgi:adenosylcobinamide-phosphate synthase